MQKEAKDFLILALDVDTMEEAQSLVRELKGCVSQFKVPSDLMFLK